MELAHRPVGNQPLSVSRTATRIDVDTRDLHYSFDVRTGLPVSLVHRGSEFLDRPAELNIWRAPTDNDRHIRLEWERAHYHQAAARAYAVDVSEEPGHVTISAEVAVVAPTVQPVLRGQLTWTITDSDVLSLNLRLQRTLGFPSLPCLGLRLFLPESMNQVDYCGMGPQESYVDKHRASYHGFFNATVADLHQDYIRPQENGSHADCNEVIISDSDRSLTALALCPFSFNASHYTQEELVAQKRNTDLTPSGSTVLCLDAAMAGIGSNSCGPTLRPKYQVKNHELEMDLHLLLTTF